jgi:nucleotide-binding universal stress UspA family protein
MYRRILVPVDGSDASMIGLRQALALAKDQNARVRILNVVDESVLIPMMEPTGAAVYTDVIESLRDDGQRVLAQAHALAKKQGVRAEAVQIESRARPVSEIILADARRSKADVIVMGTHGRRGLNRLLLGSDAERVLRDAAIPVLLTRRAPPARRRASKQAAKARAGKPRKARA